MVFAFQSLDVLLNWMGGNSGIGGAKAFGPFPSGPLPITYSESEVAVYGLVNLVIALVGVGLTILGTWVASRRGAKDVVSVH